MYLAKLKQFTDEITKENGSKYKETVLEKYKDDKQIKHFLSVLLDPNIVFGIQMKKLEKAFESVEFEFDENYDTYLDDMIQYVITNNTGSSEVLKEVVAYIKHMPEQYHDMLSKVFTKSLKLGVTANTLNRVFGKNFIFQLKVMRSKAYDDHKKKLLNKEVIATIKVDGVRMVVLKKDNDIKALSRSGKQMLGYEHILNELKGLPDGLYDGEVVYENKEGLSAVDVRQKTASLANTKEGDRSELEYIVFDHVTLEELDNQKGTITYEKRRNTLTNLVSNLENISIVPMVYKGKEFDKHVDKLMQFTLESGEEGLMVALADGVYEFKQTDKIQKVKPKYHIDLRVIDTYNGLTLNTQNELGGVIVKYKGFDLKVGTGWTKEQRKLYHEQPELIIDKIIEIEHSGESQNKQGGLSVNFPRIVAIREDKDEESYE